MGNTRPGLARQFGLFLLFAATVAHGQPRPHDGTFLDASKFMDCNSSVVDDCKKLATQYYKHTGIFDFNGNPSADKGTIARWRAFHHFNANPSSVPPNASDEVRVSYYNHGDLGIGRDMHCKRYDTPVSSPFPGPGKFETLACYVTNYGDSVHNFSLSNVGEAIANAAAAKDDGLGGHNPIATVVMETTFVEGFGFRESEVSFAAFDQAGQPVTEATLDISNNGQNRQAVPGTCISCHGGYGADGPRTRVKAAGGQVIVQNARFLPFDTTQFLYGNGTRKVPTPGEQDQFRKLNAMIHSLYKAWSEHPIKDLIEGWYASCAQGVGQVGCVQDTTFVPAKLCPPFNPNNPLAGKYQTCGWTTGAPNFPQTKPGYDIKNFYLSVPAKYCRSCHVGGFEQFNVQSFASWMGQGPGGGTAILVDLFARRNAAMPFAEAAYNNFVSDTAAVKALADFLDPREPPKLRAACLIRCANTKKACDAEPNPNRPKCRQEWRQCVKECPL